jgi:two-component system response regulator RegX3
MTRVLVVEDEESFSDALSYMLRREGFDAVVAATGPEALAEFDRGGADIVLLDLMLPGLPGTEVCRAPAARCRSSCSRRRTPRSTRSSASSSAPTTT